jgi:hypothetical protein
MRLQKPLVDFAQIGSRIINRRSLLIGGVMQKNHALNPSIGGDPWATIPLEAILPQDARQ